ncbi:MAG: SpoIIIAH-like family protein [Natronincolaceae bacterium]|jgi:stage III sporulation protein AH|nr:SpoIIIAH-like family protein [Bacillota bacterium]NLK91490.1 SpoIIIAH-like family protein [Clostridiales bacterium]
MKLTAKVRKNFAILSLVLMLGLIGYVNYSLNQQALLDTSSELEKYELTLMEENDGLLDETAVFEENETEDVVGKDTVRGDLAQEGEEEKMSNALIVDSKSSNQVTELAEASDAEIAKTVTSKKLMKSSAYFIESKLERDKKRSELITGLNNIIEGQNTGEEMRAEALGIKLNTITNTEKETFVENMIMAKGFDDAVVYLGDQSINIVVSSENLTEKDVAQIVDIVKRETDIEMDNIVIMSKK